MKSLHLLSIADGDYDLESSYGVGIHRKYDILNMMNDNENKCVSDFGDRGDMAFYFKFNHPVTLKAVQFVACKQRGPKKVWFYANKDLKHRFPRQLEDHENINPTTRITFAPEQLSANWPPVELNGYAFEDITEITIYIENNQTGTDCIEITRFKLYAV